MGTTSQKLTYLATTKDKLKTTINYTGANITTDTFRSYPEKLYNEYIDLVTNGTEILYNNLPKIIGSGTNIKLNNTSNGKMSITYKGDTQQDSTPTPSSPQPIHNVTGDNTIEICGKNLFDKNSSGIISNSYIDVNGSVVNNSPFDISDYIRVEQNQKYTYFGITTPGTAPYSAYYDKNKNFISSFKQAIDTNTITTPNNAYYVRFSIKNQNQDDRETFMIQKGETATTYEAYTGQSQLISLGVENLFDDSVERKNGYPNAGPNYIGQVVSYQNSGATYSYVNCAYLEANETYTLSWTQSTTPQSTNERIGVLVDNNNIVLEVIRTWLNNVTSITFTPTQSGYLILATDIHTSNIQITKGSTPQRVSENPIELNKINTYQDYIYKDNDRWFLHKEIGKVVLDGSESYWYKSSTYQGSFYLGNNNAKFSGLVIPFSELYCNYFTRANITSSSQISTNYTQGTCFIENNKGALDFWYDDGTTTLENFKTWLGTHNIITYFPLATPTNTEITDTTLLTQLQTILKSKSGQTNINQENNDLPFIITASAIKKYE